jgi:hypothetical protein
MQVRGQMIGGFWASMILGLLLIKSKLVQKKSTKYRIGAKKRGPYRNERYSFFAPSCRENSSIRELDGAQTTQTSFSDKRLNPELFGIKYK